MTEKLDNANSATDTGLTGPSYWRSLDELADTNEFREVVSKEFPNYEPAMITGSSRRTFLKLMGASVGLAGLAGCRRWPKRQLAPHTKRPEGHVPGEAEYYATAYEFGGVAKPLLVTTYDGRPTKIEGNPDHPGTSGGAADLFAQSSILDLYDPARYSAVLHRGSEGAAENKSWDHFDDWLSARIDAAAAKDGEGFAVLCEPTSSDTLAGLKEKLLAKLGSKATWHTYAPLADRGATEGAKLAFGKAVRTLYDLSKADLIVSFDANFLVDHPDHVRLAGQFADGRRSVETRGKMNRLYVAESTHTVTGGASDVRLPATTRDIARLVHTLAATMGIGGAQHDQPDGTARFYSGLINDLNQHKGRAVLIAGPTMPASVHALCHAINEKIGAFGKTVSFTEIEDDYTDALPEGLDTLIVLGGNPMYDGTPALKRAIETARHTAHLSLYDDETSRACEWHLPRAHYLEAWGDCRSFDGTYSVVQPMIQPLFGGRSAIELLAHGLHLKEHDGRKLVMATAAKLGSAGEKPWRRLVHDGFAADSGYPAVSVTARRGLDLPPAAKPMADAVEVVLRNDAKLYDGRFANNGWLQELPDPMTRITWDNTATISVPDANEWGLKHGDVVKVTANGAEVELPVYILPGAPVGVVTLTLGYGRTVTGPVGVGVGVDCYPLRGKANGWMAMGAIAATGKSAIKLANTTDHHAIDQYMYKQREQRVKKELVRSTTLTKYKKDPAYAAKPPHKPVALPMLNEANKGAPGFNTDSQTTVPDGFSKDRGPQQFENPLDMHAAENAHQWGMTIDLNTCIGCGSCVVACQAENNIPIVGRSQVIMNREMHWLRVDRYFTGDPAKPESVKSATQPMTCVHCETAPCEQVCPVAATVHDHEGLNVMVYNRCIGTRYCANNCPYKVRRFNYFDWNARDPRNDGNTPPFLGIPDQQPLEQVGNVTNDGQAAIVERMKFNPEVTVRMRGVMEKCTYCVQRIQKAKHDAYVEFSQDKRDKPVVKEGEIKTACQQTCPTHSIVFGNLKDPSSEVATIQYTSPRAYGVLDHLNLRPRTKYLAKITNPATEDDDDHGGGH